MEELFGISELTLISRVHRLQHRYPGKITPDELREVIKRSKGKCCWCSKDVRGSDLTIEHFGATNDPVLLGVACFSCNSSHKTGFKKRAEIPEELLKHRETRVDLWKGQWKSLNGDLYKALRHAEYLRRKEKHREYYRLNREHTNALRREHYQEKHDMLLSKQQTYREANKDRIAEQRKQWRAEHPEEHSSRFKEWYDANKKEQAARAKAYRDARKDDPEYREKIKARKRADYAKRREEVRAKQAEYRERNAEAIKAQKREAYYRAKAASA